MNMAKAKPIIKAAALDKTISTATDSLSKACGEATTAVTVKVAEAKKTDSRYDEKITRH